MSQIFTVTLPDIGEGVVEGEVVEWLKKVGDPLEQDEPVVVVMTDKATVELPAPYPGTLSRLYYQPGQVAIKDQPLYDIETEAEASRALATPYTRKLAKDAGVDINKVIPSREDKRIISEDFVHEKHESDDEVVPLFGVKGLMAKKMAESKRTIPHFSYFEKANAERLLQLRKSANMQGESEGIHVTYMPFFIKALSLTIEKFPVLNSSLDQEELLVHKQHNIGVAMSTKYGLIVPVLRDVQEMSLEQVIRAFEDFKQKAINNQISPSEMKGATITISNYGVFGSGGLWATPIINPPEVAILAVNKIQKQPVVKDDALAIADILNLSWSFDHRVIDGDLASHVSHAFARLIENPAQLLVE